MRIAKIVIIVIVILAAAALGLYLRYQTTSLKPVSPVSSKLSLAIQLPKSNYQVGEKVTGDYLMKYDGPSFEGLILYTYSRKDIPQKYYHKARGLIEDVDFSDPNKTRALKTAFSAYRLNNSGFECCLNSFPEPGEYQFGLAVYDCKRVEEVLQKSDCGGPLASINPDLLSKKPPLQETAKTVIVAPQQKPSAVLDCKESTACFEPKFKACEPAKVSASLGQTVTYSYEIIGPEGGLCRVKSKFLKNPNPDFLNKEMVCSYDNKKDFSIAAQDLSKCSGPLYELLK